MTTKSKQFWCFTKVFLMTQLGVSRDKSMKINFNPHQRKPSET